MKRTSIIAPFLFSLFIQAQDIHYSQFDKTKSLFNPSLIANQNDDYEVQLQRRSQWYSVTVPFNTFSISFNAKEIYKSFSLGATVLNDVVGDSYFSTDGLSLSIVNLVNTKDNYLAIALQTAYYQRSVNYDNLIFLANEELKNTKFSFFDIGLSISNHRILDRNSSILFGISSYHLNMPNQTLTANEEVFLKPKYIIHSSYYTTVHPRINISPTAYFSFQNQDSEIIFGSGITYKINNDVGINTGIYARIKDSFFMTLGVQKENLEVLVSFDINTSTLVAASNYVGGFEFSIRYGWSIVLDQQEVEKKKCVKYL